MRSVLRDLDRRAACGSHSTGSDPVEYAGQLTVEQSLKVAARREQWRESSWSLARPTGDAYDPNPSPSHIDAVG